MINFIKPFSELTKEEMTFAGGKGSSLARMYQAGFPVPNGFVILPTAFESDRLKLEAWKQIQVHLETLREATPDVSFAVRSSALSEDSVTASFAGEFESVLNVKSDDDIQSAIQTVYHSRYGERVKTYSEVKGMNSSHDIAVIVQMLVKADSSGVMFTANPITGARHEVMITAAWGLGEAIVGGSVTPDTLIAEQETGLVLKRDTADKQVMTVRTGSQTEEQPVLEHLRRVPVLSDENVIELVQLGTQIETFFGMPMDIEWVLAEREFTIVQARPITALPEPEPLPPTEWKLPRGAYSAMRNNIVELMADPLTPLFATLGLEAINASMTRTLNTFFGKSSIMPDEIIIKVNDYAYYNGSLKPMQIVRILLGSVGIARRMFTGAVERWTDDGHPRYISIVKHWEEQPWQQFSTRELLNASRELTEAAIDAYMSLVSGVIPAAWISEGLFTLVYNLLIRRRNDPLAQTFLLGFDSTPIQAEKALYDLSQWVRQQPDLATYLSNTSASKLATQLKSDSVPRQIEPKEWQEWQSRFQRHLKQYGHTIYNLDFANPVPADDPVPLLETLKMFIMGGGVNPHIRQQKASERRKQSTAIIESRLKGIRRNLFCKRLSVAQRYAPLREDGLVDIGLSYPLLRRMLYEVGYRLVTGGMIEAPEDVFWLQQTEVLQAAEQLNRGEILSDMAQIVQQRKIGHRVARRITPPRMLPQIKIFGRDLTKIRLGRAKGHNGKKIKGVAASPGQITATACVLHGPEDFAEMKTGDVLVAPLTTPAWTPLFARAVAVVTDIGGPLSHGSIVAREYGIPAVLGTNVATERIQSGQIVMVDGSEGIVTILEAET